MLTWSSPSSSRPVKIDRQLGEGTQPRRLLHDACFLRPTPAMTFSLQGASISTYLDESAEIRNQRISRCCHFAIQLLTCHEFRDSANNSPVLSRLSTGWPQPRWPADWVTSPPRRGSPAAHETRLRRKTCNRRATQTVDPPPSSGRANGNRHCPLWGPAVRRRRLSHPARRLHPTADGSRRHEDEVLIAAKCPANTQFRTVGTACPAGSATHRLRRRNTRVMQRFARWRAGPAGLTQQRRLTDMSTRPAAATRPDISPMTTGTTRL